MTDMKDIEQRAKDLIEQCRIRKAQRENAGTAGTEEQMSPYLEKAMKRAEQEREKHDEAIKRVRK